MSVTNISKNTNQDILQSLLGADKLPLSEIRSSALSALQELGLPGNKHEEYKHTQITRALEKNFDFSANNSTQVNISSVDSFIIPGLDAYAVVFVNGMFNQKLSTIKNLSGIECMPMDVASKEHIDLLATHIRKYASDKTDTLTAWNTAGWTNGVFLSIANNVQVDKPIVIYHITDAEQQVVSLVRNLFIVGKNSEATVIQKFDSIGNANHFTNIVTEATVEDNASLNFYQIQADKGKQYQFNQTTIHQTNSSRANAFTFTLSGELIRNNLHMILNGEGCESHMYGLYLLKDRTLADNHTVADHQKPNSFSNELYKGIIDGNAKGVFNGKIYVRPNAQKTNAFQSNRNVLLSDGATINTKPQLEIWADDVKCSHGCTSGQLDEEALFYLQTRGISKEVAQGMVLTAFAGEVVNAVTLPVLKEYFEHLIATRLHEKN